ncbi:RNA polymerase subunit sigma-24 [Streptomyces griseofuscus]|uniref:RNA polymerase sigma factor SigJ n=1 Tax=Streptomyces griseofuscus TaxID=146922 RepID=UPI000F645B14|nr:RNA polymerase sigma factor SigJ [Streptomyces griseofuscus]RRQ76772.1 RNA polymerase subunit sigma-24 [Streptomyces griseofuscus]
MTRPPGPGTGPEPQRYDTHLGEVIGERGRLIGLAYRLLGSLAEAEDAVQETYARWYAMSRSRQDAIESPGAWLRTVATRVCLDLLGSARTRRERYVGEWIPEPLPERTGWVGAPAGTATADPADRVTMDESVGMAFLVALESMTPAQRVALILHDVFRYSFTEIAEITGRTPPACRQLASSARRRVRALRPLEAPAAQQADLVRNFRRAWEAQDIGTLIGLLDPDATFTADGGGLAKAALHPVQGGVRIAHYLAALAARKPAGLVILERTVNGRPGLMARWEGATVAVYAFDVVDDRIKSIWAVRNPEKLRPWTGGGGEGAGAG